MKALILAAGLGTRLGKLTRDCPKPMIEIGGMPVLEHQLNHLNRCGIYQIGVNLHYLPEKIYKDWRINKRAIFSYEPELLGEEGTISSWRSWLEGDYFVVQNGDTLNDLAVLELFDPFSQDVRWWDIKKDCYAGTRICGPDYFNLRANHAFKKKSFSMNYWIDMGTPEGLSEAKKHYANDKHTHHRI